MSFAECVLLSNEWLRATVLSLEYALKVNTTQHCM